MGAMNSPGLFSSLTGVSPSRRADDEVGHRVQRTISEGAARLCELEDGLVERGQVRRRLDHGSIERDLGALEGRHGAAWDSARRWRGAPSVWCEDVHPAGQVPRLGGLERQGQHRSGLLDSLDAELRVAARTCSVCCSLNGNHPWPVRVATSSFVSANVRVLTAQTLGPVGIAAHPGPARSGKHGCVYHDRNGYERSFGFETGGRRASSGVGDVDLPGAHLVQAGAFAQGAWVTAPRLPSSPQ